jgi:hypothetical protein
MGKRSAAAGLFGRASKTGSDTREWGQGTLPVLNGQLCVARRCSAYEAARSNSTRYIRRPWGAAQARRLLSRLALCGRLEYVRDTLRAADSKVMEDFNGRIP